MKTLFLTNEYPPYIYGGAGVHVDYLSQELSKHMNVDVRCFGDQEVLGGPLSVKGYGYDKHVFSSTSEELKSPLQALSRCIGFCAEPVDADIVHCHTWYTHFGGILAKIIYGIPFVLTTHSLEPLRPWKREQLGRGYDLSCWIENTALQMADGIIAVSQSMKDDLIELFDIEEKRIHVIYNGIDTDEYRRTYSTNICARFGIDVNLPYVLFVGRVTRQKGIIHLVNAIRHLDSHIQVVLCAGAPDTREIAQEMEDGINELLKIRSHVIWIPEMVDKNTLIELYSNAAIFCCPSIYEPFGIIILEAMACGVPVIASSVGGIREVVVDGETGLLVPLEQHRESPYEPKDPEQFAWDLGRSINQLMANESLRQKMGMAGRRRAVESFSWSSIAGEVRDLYTRIIEET